MQLIALTGYDGVAALHTQGLALVVPNVILVRDAPLVYVIPGVLGDREVLG